MKSLLKKIYRVMLFFGINPIKMLINIKGIPFYIRTRNELKQQQSKSIINFPFGNEYPILHEHNDTAGVAKGDYFHQDLLVARKIFKNAPELHVDIGSRIDGFVAHVASYREIEVLDIRTLVNKTHNILFKQFDLMGEIDNSLKNYTDSISCLHALEHFGLGRYGDPVNFEGYIDGLNNIYMILKKGGKFYFSVPIGPQRIEFNAHRVFSIEYLLELLKDYRIDTFSYVNDKGDLNENISLEDKDSIRNNFGCTYGCGIFELTKI